MTTKPRVKKFRVRRNALGQPGAEADGAPGAAAPEAAHPHGSSSAEIDAIRAENLTGRQLRMARRVAQKNGLNPVSDYDAVRQLRAKGIDPFKAANVLNIARAAPPGPADPTPTAAPKPESPAATPEPSRNLPGAPASPAERRLREVAQIQREIAGRRRKRLFLLLTRLSFFVFLPTLLAGWYFAVLATPMYSTKSEFLILQNDGGAGTFGGLLQGTQFATLQDSIAVQSYLTSLDAMIRLNNDEDFNSAFSQPGIDALQRLAANPSIEQSYKIYKRAVKVGYDPTEGVLRMEVIAPRPEQSVNFSNKLISYAEERVDNLSREKRDDQMKEATAGFESAERERRAALERLIDLQLKHTIIDPEGKISALRARISTFEVQLEEKRLQLQALLDNARPNRSRVDGVRGDIRRLEALVADLNSQMTEASKGEESLARLSAQMKMAQADVATREAMLQTAMEKLESFRMEATRQVRYLTTSVNPVEPQDPSYPRVFENTLVAFFIFAGIYLMLSLTASILREQASN